MVDDHQRIVDAFRARWMKRMDVALPLPTLVLGGLVMYLADYPWWCLLCLICYVVSNVLLSRVAERVDSVRPDGPLRIAVNALSAMALIVVAGPEGHGWIITVMPAVASVFAPTFTTRVLSSGIITLSAVLASWWVGMPLSLVAVAGALLGTTSYLSLVLYQSIFQVWAQAERRRGELQEKNGQLHDALAARQEFLATMSHEVRTPLNGVLGMAELLQRTDLNAEQREMLDTVQQSGFGLLQVLNDILDASRLDAGAVKLECIAYAPSKVVQSVVGLLRPTMDAEHVRLLTSCSGVPDAVLGDPARLRQVMLNLVGNALKFTDQGSVSVSMDWSDDTLTIHVTDTGIGICEDAIDSLFEPFVQAEAGIVRRFGGTGLGLNISHRLVGLMNGEISVESELAVGSRFTVKLPAPIATVATPEVVAEVAVDVMASRVLFADDNAVNRMVTERMLMALSCTAVCVEDGAQALAAMERDGPFDLVLMDCRMPVMDGLEATRILRQRGVSVPIFALTAGVTEEERVACVESGMDGVLAKPLTLDALRKALSEVRGHERASA